MSSWRLFSTLTVLHLAYFSASQSPDWFYINIHRMALFFLTAQFSTAQGHHDFFYPDLYR